MADPDLRARIDLPPTRRAPEAARRLLEDLFQAWSKPHLDQMGDDARVVISEIVTNAVKYAGDAGTLRMDVAVEPDGTLRMSLCDGSSDRPVAHEADPTSVGGRGLHIVQCLTARWGVVPAPGEGKEVWVELARTSPAPS